MTSPQQHKVYLSVFGIAGLVVRNEQIVHFTIITLTGRRMARREGKCATDTLRDFPSHHHQTTRAASFGGEKRRPKLSKYDGDLFLTAHRDTRHISKIAKFSAGIACAKSSCVWSLAWIGLGWVLGVQSIRCLAYGQHESRAHSGNSRNSTVVVIVYVLVCVFFVCWAIGSGAHNDRVNQLKHNIFRTLFDCAVSKCVAATVYKCSNRALEHCNVRTIRMNHRGSIVFGIFKHCQAGFFNTYLAQIRYKFLHKQIIMIFANISLKLRNKIGNHTWYKPVYLTPYLYYFGRFTNNHFKSHAFI